MCKKMNLGGTHFHQRTLGLTQAKNNLEMDYLWSNQLECGYGRRHETE